MTPCVGVVGLCPPLCTWEQLNDGTYNLADVQMFHFAIEEMIAAREAAKPL